MVGQLVLKNQGAKPALLVAGELFEGGCQHRALKNDILLVPGHPFLAASGIGLVSMIDTPYRLCLLPALTQLAPSPR